MYLQREKLVASGKVLTKVTLESFMAWKRRKVRDIPCPPLFCWERGSSELLLLQLKEKQDKEEKASSQRKKAFMAGKVHGVS